MSDANLPIITRLSHIADAYKSKGVIYKYKAYRTAISTLKSLTTPITSVADVRNLPGIGKAMEEKIGEILATGGLEQEEQVLADPITRATQLFTSIHGIGPVMAAKLVHEQGLRTLEDLKRVPLPAQVQLGIKYYEDSQCRIPFNEVKRHMLQVEAICTLAVDPEIVVTVCGSHRRGNKTSGDVDILLSQRHTRSTSKSEYVYMQEVIRALTRAGYIVDTLVEGAVKFMGYSRLLKVEPGPTEALYPVESSAFSTVRRLDVRWFCYDHFYSALLYFTGSDAHNIKMRQQAINMGYVLSEYGIFKAVGAGGDSPQKMGAGAMKGERVPTYSEEEIFQVLKMPYVPPEQRNL
jgi:DNA polymerase/3'-5' exonuclease PolX